LIPLVYFDKLDKTRTIEFDETLPNTLLLFASLLEHFQPFRDEFITADGFQVIGHAIGPKLASVLNWDLLRALEKLLEVVLKVEVAGLLDSALQYLFLDFRSWAPTPATIQSRWWDRITALITSRPAVCFPFHSLLLFHQTDWIGLD
jgi:hypothetical protein